MMSFELPYNVKQNDIFFSGKLNLIDVWIYLLTQFFRLLPNRTQWKETVQDGIKR